MKRLLLVAATIFFVLGGGQSKSFAQVKSDYEITQSFERENKSIQKAIESANTMVECVDVESRMTELETKYRRHKTMLDPALYPDGFDGRMMKLRGQISYAKGKIEIIESQYTRITDLETQVRSMSEQVERLSVENTSMLKEVKRLSTSRLAIDSLNAVVIKLRQNLRDRDDLVFSLVDSLFLQYDKDISKMSYEERQGVAARLERKNVFANIKRAIADNLQFLEATKLTGTDIAKLSNEQKQFQSKWDGLGKKIADVYVASKAQRAKEIGQIDTLMVQWKKKLDSLFWKSLNEVFASHHMPVKPFNTVEEFYVNLNAYLDEEIRKARDEKDGQRFFRYQAFADSVWTTQLEPFWIPAMIEEGKLTEKQRDAVADKVDEWKDIVSPPLTVVYIIVGVVILVVVLYLYRRYTKTQAAAGGTPAAPSSPPPVPEK